MRGLSEKVAIITGGARGMGESHVRRFIEEGAKVVFTDINTSAGEALAEELGGNAVFVEHDVTDADGWKAVVAQAESAFGPVNVLVNNAGISMSKSIFEMTEEEYRKIIDINQVSVFLGIKAVLRFHAEGGRTWIHREHLVHEWHRRRCAGLYRLKIRSQGTDESRSHPARRTRHPGQFGSSRRHRNTDGVRRRCGRTDPGIRQQIPMKRTARGVTNMSIPGKCDAIPPVHDVASVLNWPLL